MKLRLKELREAQCLSQRDLAVSSGVAATTILYLEHGKRSPSFRTIRALAKALGVDPAELVIRDEPEEPNPPPARTP